MHKGIDFGAPSGAPIVAASDGQVVAAGWAGGYGRQVPPISISSGSARSRQYRAS